VLRHRLAQGVVQRFVVRLRAHSPLQNRDRLFVPTGASEGLCAGHRDRRRQHDPPLHTGSSFDLAASKRLDTDDADGQPDQHNHQQHRDNGAPGLPEVSPVLCAPRCRQVVCDCAV
jgi:hypothetical protein